MNMSDATAAVGAALRAGAGEEAAPAVRSLHEALRRSLGDDAEAFVGPRAVIPAEGPDVSATTAAWQERLHGRLLELPEADLEELRHLGYAVLMLTDPEGMALGRYAVIGSQTVQTVLSATLPVAAGAMPVPAGLQPEPSDPVAVVRQAEQAVARHVRLRGNDHQDTLAARCDLGLAYASVGRTMEAVDLLRRVVVDMGRTLGTDHPDTHTARARLVLAESLGRRVPRDGSGGEP